MEIKDKVIVALDLAEIAQAERIVEDLYPLVKIFKIGSILFTAAGPSAIEMVQKKGAKVFLDLKFYDIPSVVAGACEIASRYKPFMLTVHIQGGKEMLHWVVEACRRIERAPLIIGVTVLTSFDRQELNRLGIIRSLRKQVVYLSRLAKDVGLDGVVASAREAYFIRKSLGKGFIIVTPGIRTAGGGELKKDDQKRVATPEGAFCEDIDYIVMGRTIIGHRSPRKRLEEILSTFQTTEIYERRR